MRRVLPLAARAVTPLKRDLDPAVVLGIAIAGRIHCHSSMLTEFTAPGVLFYGMRGYEQGLRPALVGAYE